MSTHILHIGDAHMKPGPRSADRWKALDQILDAGIALAKQQKLGAWVIPGDLNDARMSIEDRNAWVIRLTIMAEWAPVVLCYGNHDLPGDLDVFARLRALYPIHVVDRPRVIGVMLATGETAGIFVLPYPTKAGLVAAGVAHETIIPTASDALDAIFMKAAADLEDARQHGHLTFMLGHVNVAGSLTSAGQPNIGQEIEISHQHLDRLGPIYKGLNHIHKHQELAGAMYAGSICRLNWGEVEPKGYLDILFQDSTRWGWTFSTIDVPPMYHVEGELVDGFFTWRCTAGPNGPTQEPPKCLCGGQAGCLDCCGTGANWKGCEVRVRAIFPQSRRSTLDFAAVQAQFAGALRFELEPIARPDRNVREPEIATKRTLAEKLAVIDHVDTLTPGRQEKLAALEHGDPAVVLAGVRDRLATLEGKGENAVVAA